MLQVCGHFLDLQQIHEADLHVVYCFQDAGKNKKELHIFMRCFTRIKKIDSVICCNRPVVMFTEPLTPANGFS